MRSMGDEGDESAALSTKNKFDDGPAVKSTSLKREVSIQRTFQRKKSVPQKKSREDSVP